MGCYSPLQAFKTPCGQIHFQKPFGRPSMALKLPCGQCIGCRLERSRQWAARCHHEAMLYDYNSFITLTYNNDHVPDDMSLNKKHFQDFMKRLRDYLKHHPEKFKGSNKVRFFHCGEYGDSTHRPHYHACLFGIDFSDKIFWKETKTGEKLYISETLSRLWPFGFSTIGTVTFDSAAYVARYVMKKITGKSAKDHYGNRQPEYTTMSRKPGIGQRWIAKHMDDTYKDDSIVVKGFPSRPPRYYDSQFELVDTERFASIKLARRKKAIKLQSEKPEDFTPERLRVAEEVKKASIRKLKRNVD